MQFAALAVITVRMDQLYPAKEFYTTVSASASVQMNSPVLVVSKKRIEFFSIQEETTVIRNSTVYFV